MPDLAFFGPKLYYKNAIKFDSAGIAVFAYYEVPDLDLISRKITTLRVTITTLVIKT
jgi:hypothetical protein